MSPNKGNPAPLAAGRAPNSFCLAAERTKHSENGPHYQGSTIGPLSGTKRRRRRTKKPDAGDAPWLSNCLLDDGGRVIANLANVLVCLRTDPAVASAFVFDEMMQTAMLVKPLPVAPKGKPAGDDPLPRPIRDEDVSQLQEFLQHSGLPSIGRDIVHQAVDQRARERSCHPVRQWLDQLVWDRVERLSRWLETYLGAIGPAEYLAAIG